MKYLTFKSIKCFNLYLIITCLFIGTETKAQFEKRVIIASGKVAPGTKGAVFSNLGNPTAIGISSAGRILFSATLEPGIGDTNWDNNLGTWAEENGEITLIYRKGEVPGLSGQKFKNHPKFFIDLAGQIAMEGEYSSTGEAPFTHGFFMEENGNMILKVHDGMEISSGVKLMAFDDVAAFNMGSVIFKGYLSGDGIDNNNDAMLAMVDQNGLKIVCRKGNSTPYVEGDYLNDNFGFYKTLNVFGNTLFWISGKDNSGQTNQYKRKDYQWNQSGTIFPIIENESNLEYTFAGRRLNSKGNIFSPVGSSFDYQVSMKKNNSFFKLVAKGDSANGTNGATFNLFGIYVGFNYYPKSVMHDNDKVSVYGVTSDDEEGFWMGDENGLKKVIWTKDHAPGMEDFMFFSKVNGMEANPGGKIAIIGSANGIDKSDNNNWKSIYKSGIWFGDDNGLELLAITEELVEIDTGVIKSIKNVQMASRFDKYGINGRPRTGADGWPTNVNDRGEVVFSVQFNEGGNALFVASSGNSKKVNFSKIENGPSVTNADIPENGSAYLYFDTKSEGQNLNSADSIKFRLSNRGTYPIEVKGVFLESGLCRITFPSTSFPADSAKYSFPNSLKIDNTNYFINEPIPDFTLKKQPASYTRTWDVFAEKSAGVSGSLGFGAGASVSAAKISVSGKGGVGLKIQQDGKGNLLLDRRMEFGISQELEIPEVNFVIGDINVGKGETTVKSMMGQSFQFTDITLEDDFKKMAQSGFLLETFSFGGLGLSPFIGIVSVALVQTINNLSDVNSVFDEALVNNYWGVGAEGRFGLGLDIGIDNSINYKVQEASFGGAMQAKYVAKNRIPGTKSTMPNNFVGKSGSSFVFELASNFNIKTLPFQFELADGVELGSGNFSLFDVGAGGAISLSANYEASSKFNGLSVGLKGGGGYSILGDQENTYFNTTLEFSPAHFSALSSSSTSIGKMVSSAALIPLSPITMSNDAAIAMNEVLEVVGQVPIRITTAETRGKSYELGLNASFDFAVGLGIGGSVGVKGSYLDEVEYSKKVSDVYLGNYNYLLSSSKYTSEMQEANFPGILMELFSGTLPLIKTALQNLVEIVEQVVQAGQDFLVKAYSKTKDKVGELAGTAQLYGRWLIITFPTEVSRIVLKSYNSPEVRKMYYSTDVYHKTLNEKNETNLEEVETVLIIVSEAMTVGFVPDGKSISLDSLESSVELKMIIDEQKLLENNFTADDKEKIKIYYYHTDSISWILEGGIRNVDTVSTNIFKMGTYALGIELDITNDKTGPTIYEKGPMFEQIVDNTPEIYAKIRDDRFGTGIDLSKTHLILNNDTLDSYYNPTMEKVYFQVPDSASLRNGVYQVTIIASDFSGNVTTTSFSFTIAATTIEDFQKSTDEFVLYQNYPNPFNRYTEIKYYLPEKGKVEINIYNVNGKFLKRLFSNSLPAGEHSIIWDGLDIWGKRVSSGTYFYQLKYENLNVVKKMEVSFFTP